MLLADLSNPAQRPTRYFYGGESQWQVCAERGAFSQITATYVYGNYIDEVLQMQRCEAGPPSCTSTPPADYYYHTDDLYNVMAVTDDAGNVVERYEYDDYGTPMVMDAAGNALALSDGTPATGASGTAHTSSAIANPYLFTGRRFDPETAWYHYRTRYLDPQSGRFTTRDTIAIWGDDMGVGNGYPYVASNPFSWNDPFGLTTPCPTCGDKFRPDLGEVCLHRSLQPTDCSKYLRELARAEENLEDCLKRARNNFERAVARARRNHRIREGGICVAAAITVPFSGGASILVLCGEFAAGATSVVGSSIWEDIDLADAKADLKTDETDCRKDFKKQETRANQDHPECARGFKFP